MFSIFGKVFHQYNKHCILLQQVFLNQLRNLVCTLNLFGVLIYLWIFQLKKEDVVQNTFLEKHILMLNRNEYFCNSILCHNLHYLLQSFFIRDCLIFSFTSCLAFIFCVPQERVQNLCFDFTVKNVCLHWRHTFSKIVFFRFSLKVFFTFKEISLRFICVL